MFVSDDPDDAGTDVRPPDAPGLAVVRGVGERRVYVHLFDPASGFVVAAEPALGLEGAVNLRDVGGLPVRGGGHLRWGRLLRSGRLDGLGPAALEALAGVGVGTVVDLRTPDEAAAAPDRLPPGAVRLERPMSSDPSGLRTMAERIRSGEIRRYGEVEMAEGYLRILSGHGHVVAEVAELVASADSAVLVHCTAGKDRTGLVVAALLAAVGVAEADLLDDYEASERHLPPDRGEALSALLVEQGLDPDDFTPLWSSPRPVMALTLRLVSERWGSMTGYLDDVGVDAGRRARLREALVAPAGPANP